MKNIFYIDDLFIEFYDYVQDLKDRSIISSYDFQASQSFYHQFLEDKPLTEKQAKFVILLLKKYLYHISDLQIYYNDIEKLNFKNVFRTVNYHKKVYIEVNNHYSKLICFKFPFVFKNTYDEEFEKDHFSRVKSAWDSENQVRTIHLNDVNIIRVYDFAVKHEFEIDQSIIDTVMETEVAWEIPELVEPYSRVINNSVSLVNAVDDAVSYFTQHKKDNIIYDAFLAKTMGHPLYLNYIPKTPIEKIVNNHNNKFWLRSIDEFLQIYLIIQGKIAIIIDRCQDKQQWIIRLLESAEKLNIPRNKIKACFRGSSKTNPELNDWIKENELGGSIEDGDIYLFEHKPAKWLFKKPQVKILATTLINPPTNHITKEYLDSHPCVFYVTDVFPTVRGNDKIEKL